jgi:hypothetical protein
MSDRWLTAAFFVARSDATLDDLAVRAGVHVKGGPHVRRDGGWAGLDVQVTRERLSFHDCLRIQLRQAAFLAARPLDLPEALPLDDDPSLPIAAAFRDACLALSPEVGVFLTRPGLPDRPDPIEALYSHVLGIDGDALAHAHVGLLYLDARFADGVAASPGRDVMPASPGRLLFAGRGQARWY